MKTYIEFPNTLLLDTVFIPKDITNFEYVKALEEIKNNLAVIRPFNIPVTWEKIRAQRDQLLKDSDWTILSDATPKPNKDAWAVYRQILRQIPQKFSTPESVVWPTKPE